VAKVETMERIVLATRNRGKIEEIRSILSELDVELVGLDSLDDVPVPEETGETFLENALIKARAVHEATGLFALADDSGLEVDALDGAPGIRSARYGGEGLSDKERYMKLLSEMRDVPEGKRSAHFRCVMVLYPAPGTGSKALATEGFLYGEIATSPRGENGFGYDPVFYLPERGRTVAELAAEEKNTISHRYRALVEMKWLLINEYGVNVKARK